MVLGRIITLVDIVIPKRHLLILASFKDIRLTQRAIDCIFDTPLLVWCHRLFKPVVLVCERAALLQILNLRRSSGQRAFDASLVSVFCFKISTTVTLVSKDML